jgi:hypothetical protein
MLPGGYRLYVTVSSKQKRVSFVLLDSDPRTTWDELGTGPTHWPSATYSHTMYRCWTRDGFGDPGLDTLLYGEAKDDQDARLILRC